jgi:hypothetical protein
MLILLPLASDWSVFGFPSSPQSEIAGTVTRGNIFRGKETYSEGNAYVS